MKELNNEGMNNEGMKRKFEEFGNLKMAFKTIILLKINVM